MKNYKASKMQDASAENPDQILLKPNIIWVCNGVYVAFLISKHKQIYNMKSNDLRIFILFEKIWSFC